MPPPRQQLPAVPHQPGQQQSAVIDARGHAIFEHQEYYCKRRIEQLKTWEGPGPIRLLGRFELPKEVVATGNIVSCGFRQEMDPVLGIRGWVPPMDDPGHPHYLWRQFHLQDE
jgi:hypothetical protein